VKVLFVRRRATALAALVLAVSIPWVGAGPVAAGGTAESLAPGWLMTRPSLALTTGSAQVVAYQRAGNAPGIFVASDATASWVPERISNGDDWAPDLKLDGDGHAHVAFTRFGTGQGIYYATDATGSWVVTLVAAGEGGAAKLALAPSGAVHIVFRRYGNAPGIFDATDASGTWAVDTVVASAFAEDPAVAIDGTGKVHVVFAGQDPGSEGIRYATKATPTATWSSAPALRGGRNDDRSPAILATPGNVIHIAWVECHAESRIFCDQLRHGTNNGASWSLDTPSSTYTTDLGDFGPPSIALEPQVNVSIVASYVDWRGNSAGLIRFSNATGVWASTPATLAVGGDEFPSLAINPASLPGLPELHLAWRRTSPTAGVMVGAPGNPPASVAASSLDDAPAIALDAGGKRHVAFERRTNGAETGLRYATDTTGAWVDGWVNGASGSPQIGVGPATVEAVVDGIRATRSGGTWTVTNLPNDGHDASLAVDAAGAAHIAYMTNTGGFDVLGIHYLTNASGSWVDTMVAGDFDTHGTSIAVDAAGHAHVVYWTDNGGFLKYATNKTGSWASVSLPGSEPSWPTIAVTSAGVVHIAYRGSAPGIYHLTNATGSWVTTRLSRSSDDSAPSIALDATGKAYVAFARGYWAAEPGVFVVTNRSGSWVRARVATDLDAGAAPSITVTPTGEVRLAYSRGATGVWAWTQVGVLASSAARPRADRWLDPELIDGMRDAGPINRSALSSANQAQRVQTATDVRR